MDLDSFYTSPAWVALRERVLARDGRRCTVARLLGGSCGGAMHVHHIQAVEDRLDLALDENNCASVCATHHPRWEAVRRAVIKQRPDTVPDCGHYHPYKEGREACRRKRMRDRGLLAA